MARLADRQVIAGHTRLLAARRLGLSLVPVRYLDLSPEDARLLSLADNKLGELAEWDEEALARVLADLKAQGAEITASGFDEKEIDRLLAELNASNLADVVEPPIPEVPQVARSVRGEVYQLGPHRLMCGDSTNADEVQRLMAGQRAALCATDPPYLVDYDGTNHPQSFERERAGKDNNKHCDSYVDPQSSVEFFSAFLRVALEHALVENPAIYQWHASRRQALVEAAWKENGLLLLSFAKTPSRDWTMGERRASDGEQWPSYPLCWAPYARRSEPAPTSRSRTWRSGNSLPCSAADRSDRNSGASIASSGCGSPIIGLGGESRFTSFAPRP